MKALFSVVIFCLSMNIAVASVQKGPNYECIGASQNISGIHYNLSAAYREVADLLQSGRNDRRRIVYLQNQIVNGNNALPAAQQNFNYYCSR